MSKCGEIKLRGILRMWGVPKKKEREEIKNYN
jgi:hypothetical protein